MSKLKIIDGAGVTNISAASINREIKILEFEIENKIDATNRDHFVYAYHFVRLGHLLLAQKYLNRLSHDYFDSGIYKDLTQALLAWSVSRINQNYVSDPSKYEFFLVVKRSFEMLDEVTFETKPAWYRFKKEFARFTENL